MKFIQTKIDKGTLYSHYNHAEVSNFTPAMLTPDYWQAMNAVTGSAQGRGTTWFVAFEDALGKQHDWVLRHYYRGGLIGKIITDSYWFTGLENTRAAREFSLLLAMQKLNLPAPKPIAYRVVRQHLTYQADLLSSRIQNAQDLVAILSQEAISECRWQDIGKTIKKFHDHHIYHHDLNAHNILIDDTAQVFLIDFDRGEIRNPPSKQRWKEDNIARLHRSFLKELNQLENFHFTQDNWQQLMAGYLS